MMDVAMRVPDLATNDSVVTVIRWLVAVGQPVRRGQPLVEVQTDKSAVVVESIVTGTLRTISVREGEETTAGQVIAVFDAEETPGVADAAPASARVSFFEANHRARASREKPATSSHAAGR